jgi:hypothetical protein
MKFYPRDWRGDQALRMVSLAARGLWIECLTVMHEATPYGHLVINGRPVGVDALARMVGASGDEVRALMLELNEAGVCDVTGEGVIFSRRMVRDQERAAKGRKAVKKRWSKPVENKHEIDRPNRSPNRKPITQKPEARSQRDSARDVLEEIRPEFLEAWSAYPGKQGKLCGDTSGMSAFRRAVERGESGSAIVAAAKAYAATEPTFPTGFAKWLDTGGWKAFEPERPPGTDWRGEVQLFQRFGSWRPDGPCPDQPGCKAPADVLAEFGYTEGMSA